MSPHPRGTTASPLALVSLLSVLSLLLAGFGLASPAEARSHGRTALVGWSDSRLVVTEGRSVRLKLQLQGAARAGRTALLQRRAVGSDWTTVDSDRSGRRGHVALTVPTAATSGGDLRVVVAAQRRARALVTPGRLLVVQEASDGGVSGGPSDDPGDAADEADAAPGTGSQPSTTPTRPANPSDGSLNAEEAEVLRLVNEARRTARSCGSDYFPAAGPLRAEARLTKASRAHAQDMGEKGYFSHTSADGRSPWDRSRAAGYTTASGENIAAGYPDAASVVKGWIDSPGHCRNVMAANARDLGVGFVVVEGSTYRTYWVQMFGRG